MPGAMVVAKSVPRAHRLIVVVSASLVAGLAWLWLYHASVDHAGMSHDGGMAGMSMPADLPGPIAVAAWTPGYALTIFAMWAIMMVAMMLPSAVPVLLLYDRVSGKAGGHALPQTAAFASGYLLVWIAYGAAATALQWALATNLLMAPEMRVASPGLAAAILLIAGAWQFTPLKSTCLDQCQSPIGFLSQNWKPGIVGAIRMGARHGTYCLGCCWTLMALLFVGGVMNLWWVVGIAAFVALEKGWQQSRWPGKLAGVALIAGAIVALGIVLTGS